MSSLTIPPLVTDHPSRLQRTLLWCGFASAVLYIGLDLTGASLYPDYSIRDQAISELSALGAPTAKLWAIVAPLFGLLLLAFGIGVWRVAKPRALRVSAGLILTLVALSPVWAFFPMHARGSLGGAQDLGHLVLATLSVILICSFMIAGGIGIRGWFRWVSGLLAAIVFVTFLWTFTFVDRLSASQSTPWMGVIERIAIYGYLFWIGALSLVLLDRECGIVSRALRALRASLLAHPLTGYCIAAIGISWAGVLIASGGGPIPAPPEVVQQRFVFVYLAMLLGPPVAGIAMTGAVGGKSALQDYRARLLKWRVSPGWYAIALLTAPVAVVAADILIATVWRDAAPMVFAAGAGGPVQAGSRTAFVLMSLAVGFGAGIFEELGWTGFATPELRRRYGIATAGLLLGIVWGAWHFLAVLWGSVDAFGPVSIPVFMFVALFSFLPPYRVLMTRLYERTGSLLVGILMHASLTTSLLILGPQVTGVASVTNNILFAGVLWVAAAVLVRGPVPQELRGRALNRPSPDGKQRASGSYAS